MKTTSLIHLLAQDAELPPAPKASLTLLAALVLAALLSTALVVGLWGVNTQLPAQIQSTGMWVKLLWLSCLCGLTWHALLRLARPGLNLGFSAWGALGVWLVMVALAVHQWQNTPTAEHAALVWGTSWQQCSASIVALAVPFFVASIWTLRNLAPTQPTLTGGMAGLMSGLLSALVYSLHCPETAFAFLLLWYVAGMAVMSVLGAAVGQRYLRW